MACTCVTVASSTFKSHPPGSVRLSNFSQRLHQGPRSGSQADASRTCRETLPVQGGNTGTDELRSGVVFCYGVIRQLCGQRQDQLEMGSRLTAGYQFDFSSVGAEDLLANGQS